MHVSTSVVKTYLLQLRFRSIPHYASTTAMRRSRWRGALVADRFGGRGKYAYTGKLKMRRINKVPPTLKASSLAACFLEASRLVCVHPVTVAVHASLLTEGMCLRLRLYHRSLKRLLTRSPLLIYSTPYLPLLPPCPCTRPCGYVLAVCGVCAMR